MDVSERAKLYLMLLNVLELLKKQLNDYLNAKLGVLPEDSSKEKVVFVEGASLDPIAFPLGAITILLINLEEERIPQPMDAYHRATSNGSHQKVQPSISLSLYVLFVARFPKYEETLQHLSLVIQYFQHYRIFTHDNAPTLSQEVDRLVLELITLPFREQNEVWNALRTTYNPSVLYRVRMVVFQDEDATDLHPVSQPQGKVSP